MNNIVIKRSQLVEIPILATSANSQLLFKPDQNLIGRRIKVYGFEAYSATQVATSPTGRTVIAAADAANLTINFVANGNDSVAANYPYYNSIRSNVGGFITLLTPQEFTVEKCYLTVLAAGSLSTSQSALVNIYYQYL